MSILSFPDRGQGGDAKYRGNCSPHVYEWLLKESRAQSLLDPCMGGGTAIDVALRLNLKASGSDLSTSAYHQDLKRRLEARGAHIELGLDATTADLGQIFGQHDLVVAHPAYGTQIVYPVGEGNMSAIGDGEEFYDALHDMLMNMRDTTRQGGHYAIIIGDTRKGGKYHSYQAQAIACMPRSELRAVRIKAQHNVQSGSQSYGNLKWGLTLHEYILVWERTGQLYAAFTEVRAQNAAQEMRTWKHVVAAALRRNGGQADLSTLYNTVLRDAPDRVKQNPNYQAKIRQTLQKMPNTENTERGTWRLVA